MIHSLFATQIHQGSLGLDARVRAEMKKTALNLRKIDEDGIEWCRTNYPNGYTSYGSISKLHEQFTAFERLKRKLDPTVAAFTRKLGLKFDTGDLVLSNLWVNVMPKNCYHAFHLHPLSVISGTYYVSVGKGSSPLRVEDPRASKFMATPPRKIQTDLKPRDGDVILFESWLKHEVPPHQNSAERISVSFNYDWVGR
ncbi:MAG: hypothetical protein JST80_08340 [Bdellovibrionales bacterium]|nr:hypothetical protein [Bdellovibrionales bacterium]